MMQCENLFLSGARDDIVFTDGTRVKNAKWLDTGKRARVTDGGRRIATESFLYGTSMCARVIKFKLKEKHTN